MDLVPIDEECEGLEVTETPRSAKPTLTLKHNSKNKKCLMCSHPTIHPRRLAGDVAFKILLM